MVDFKLKLEIMELPDDNKLETCYYGESFKQNIMRNHKRSISDALQLYY
ncbi:hypothetical protein SAMN04488112_103173 [Melghirimyces thermohalophilus]|uniref:Uncharacterized protein n=1 Tax=Melghirimyces thermohalophilus TaxID=1236220 RepID=A0A1G6J3V5_9BACL|nr:hypothetical protein SAMN04488112_103173 [Melghirimyces thermohalophilus]